MMHSSAVCFSFLSWLLAYRGLAQLLDNNCAAVNTHSRDLRLNTPWMALVVLPNKTCTGALIHNQFVITSASCICNQGNAIVRLGQLNSQDEHSISDEYRNEEYQVQGSYIHGFYDKSNFEHDIALLELQNIVLYKAHIRSICIWLNQTPVDTQVYTNFTTSRWRIDKKGILPRVMPSKLEVLNRTNCQNDLQMHRQSSHICVGYQNNRKCPETGSPLLKKMRYKEKLFYTLLGIQSNGELRTCLYTDVTSYIDWILGIILYVDVIVPNSENSHA